MTINKKDIFVGTYKTHAVHLFLNFKFTANAFAALWAVVKSRVYMEAQRPYGTLLARSTT